MTSAHQTIRYYLVQNEVKEEIEAEIITEMPVSLTVNGELWLSFSCTPTDLEAMAIGFLFNESLVQSIDEIVEVRVCPTGENIDVWLDHSVEQPASWRRTSGCTGGVTAIDAQSNVPFTAHFNGATLSVNQIGDLIGMLFESQDLYRKSGGVHTSALSDGQQILIVAEDIGRHNTLDKIAGLFLMTGINPPRRILLTTGRISSEMIQKSARIGASIVISRTSPSSLSIQMAERFNITLIGYARRNSFRIFTHPERVLAAPIQAAEVTEDENVNNNEKIKAQR